MVNADLRRGDASAHVQGRGAVAGVLADSEGANPAEGDADHADDAEKAKGMKSAPSKLRPSDRASMPMRAKRASITSSTTPVAYQRWALLRFLDVSLLIGPPADHRDT